MTTLSNRCCLVRHKMGKKICAKTHLLRSFYSTKRVFISPSIRPYECSSTLMYVALFTWARPRYILQQTMQLRWLSRLAALA